MGPILLITHTYSAAMWPVCLLEILVIELVIVAFYRQSASYDQYHSRCHLGRFLGNITIQGLLLSVSLDMYAHMV